MKISKNCRVCEKGRDPRADGSRCQSLFRQHEWFKQAVADPNSKYADYFIIEETDGEVPNNLRCYNGYSAWERIGDSNRFYFHCFSKEQPDLNWECEELRREIIDMMLYWQKMGVAGFRVDAIGNLKKSPKVFEHQPLPTDGTDGMAAIDPYVLLQEGSKISSES